MSTPTALSPSPSYQHHIVFLQAAFCPVPDFRLPPTHTYTQTVYQTTSLAELHARIHDASILVFSAIRLDAAALAPDVTPNLKLIVLVATGTDCVDLEACKARGIQVSNCPYANVESVSEHAIGMYFATRRRMVVVDSLTKAGEWPKRGTLMYDVLDATGQPPLTCREEVAGILGYGSVGKRIAALARALGMEVLVSERKTTTKSDAPEQASEDKRVPFPEILRRCTVVFVCVPLVDTTRHLFSTTEFATMSSHAIIVNVSRGGVVDEAALVTALRERKIAGAATDVFREEPASPSNSPLLGEQTVGLNLIVTPHLAWLAQMTWKTQSGMMKQVIEDWCAGCRSNVVV